MVKGPQLRAIAETYKPLCGYVDPAARGTTGNDATSLGDQGQRLD